MCPRLFALLAPVVILSAACAGAGGNYPAPQTRLEGRTADQYGVLAKDTDAATCQRACYALRQLGAEGVPYLLEAAAWHRDRPWNLSECLLYLDGSLLDPADVPAVGAYLNDRYAAHDGTEANVRGMALKVLKRAGPKAAPLRPRLRELRGTPKLEPFLSEALAAIG